MYWGFIDTPTNKKSRQAGSMGIFMGLFLFVFTTPPL
jgi:hypothetical protein